MNSPSQTPALPTPHFYILLALSGNNLHGYALGAVASNHALRGIDLQDGVLYPLLKKMVAAGLIEKIGQQPAGPSGQPRLHYGITKEGRYRVKNDLLRIRHALKIGENLGYFSDEMPSEIRRIIDQLK